MARLHQTDGGHEFHRGIAFPIERERDDEPVTTPEACERWACIGQVLLLAIVVGCLCAAFIQIVLPTFQS